MTEFADDQSPRFNGRHKRRPADHLRLFAPPCADISPVPLSNAALQHHRLTLGGINCFVSFWLAYDRNLSVGPTDVVLGLINFLSFLAKKLW